MEIGNWELNAERNCASRFASILLLSVRRTLETRLLEKHRSWQHLRVCIDFFLSFYSRLLPVVCTMSSLVVTVC